MINDIKKIIVDVDKFGSFYTWPILINNIGKDDSQPYNYSTECEGEILESPSPREPPPFQEPPSPQYPPPYSPSFHDSPTPKPRILVITSELENYSTSWKSTPI